MNENHTKLRHTRLHCLASIFLPMTLCLWALITSLPTVIWEEGRVAALSHRYAVKFPLVTMACPKFVPKIPLPVDRSPNPTTCLIPGPVRPLMPNGIRIRSAVFQQCTGQTDRPTDRPRESLTTIGRCATTATRPNNNPPWSSTSRFSSIAVAPLRGLQVQ